jgi:rubrerythrin
MVFERYFKLTESDRWELERDIPWREIDAGMAAAQPDVLEKLRSAALIESYAPMFALKSLNLWWESVEESAIASIQFFEEYKHYYALKRYLDAVGMEIPEREVIEIRQRNFGGPAGDRARHLANYMISEHFTAHFYKRLLDQVQEPVLRVLLNFLVRDEFRHAGVFYSLLERRLELDPSTREAIVEETLHFRHQGSEVVGESIPIAQKNDFQTILGLWKKVEHLTGVSLREYRKELLRVSTGAAEHSSVISI